MGSYIPPCPLGQPALPVLPSPVLEHDIAKGPLPAVTSAVETSGLIVVQFWKVTWRLFDTDRRTVRFFFLLISCLLLNYLFNSFFFPSP